MIESRTITGETLEKFRKLLCEEGGLPYGIGRKFEKKEAVAETAEA